MQIKTLLASLKITTHTYFVHNLNSSVNRRVIWILTTVLISSAFMLTDASPKYPIKLALALNGFLLEESLHLLFILHNTGSNGIKFRFVWFSILLLSFSWFVPKDVPLARKKIAVLAPPILVVLIGILAVGLHLLNGTITLRQACSRGAIFLCTSAISLIPFEFGKIRSDAFQFKLLQAAAEAAPVGNCYRQKTSRHEP